MSRIFAISDLHVDIKRNMEQMLSLSDWDYTNDWLVVAGDASDSFEKLEILFTSLQKKFYGISFVPGNHELWLRKSSYQNSIEKFSALRQLCNTLGIHQQPVKIEGKNNAVWLVPLYSWYRLPDEGTASLFIPKQGENWEACGWMDNVLCRWPKSDIAAFGSVADYFLSLNRAYVNTSYDAPVISFSHFLPRAELIFNTPQRAKSYTENGAIIPPHPADPHPTFNFSRVAGCNRIDEQVKQLNAIAHIYGHQHRNRCRKIEGITYISHCLGNLKEQQFLNNRAEPKLIWAEGVLAEAEDYL